MRDVFTKEKRSEVMSLIRSKGTKVEKRFRKALCENNFKGYRINPKFYANPDFIFGKYKVAIFCDGNFWHGKNYKKLKPKLKKKFWREKIERNVKRDKKYNKKLAKSGWVVLRFWESDINKHMDKCMKQVKATLKKRGYFKGKQKLCQ